MIDLTLGFIGTGGIASAMVRGFCSSPDFSGRINLTVHKNREKADALKKLFPDRISVHESNQAAADASDVVFICVLPQQHEAVVRALRFRADQRVMHITGGAKLADSLALYAPAKSAARAIPLPARDTAALRGAAHRAAALLRRRQDARAAHVADRHARAREERARA